jgi:hypothetical protein
MSAVEIHERLRQAIAAADPAGGPQPGGEGDGVPRRDSQNGVPSGNSENGVICPYCGAAFSCSSTDEPASYQVGVPTPFAPNRSGPPVTPMLEQLPGPGRIVEWGDSDDGGAPTEGRRRLVIEHSRHGSWEFRRRLRGCE